MLHNGMASVKLTTVRLPVFGSLSSAVLLSCEEQSFLSLNRGQRNVTTGSG